MRQILKRKDGFRQALKHVAEYGGTTYLKLRSLICFCVRLCRSRAAETENQSCVTTELSLFGSKLINFSLGRGVQQRAAWAFLTVSSLWLWTVTAFVLLRSPGLEHISSLGGLFRVAGYCPRVFESSAGTKCVPDSSRQQKQKRKVEAFSPLSFFFNLSLHLIKVSSRWRTGGNVWPFFSSCQEWV